MLFLHHGLNASILFIELFNLYIGGCGQVLAFLIYILAFILYIYYLFDTRVNLTSVRELRTYNNYSPNSFDHQDYFYYL